MKNNKELVLKTLKLLSIILLYYIVGSKNLFLYVLSLSLYNIFISCFNHISIKDNLKKMSTNNSKTKLLKLLLSVISVISFIFLLSSILISDLLTTFLNLNNITTIFIFEGLCIITKPLIKILSEYLENIKTNSNYKKLLNLYDILDNILLIIIALFTFRIFKLKENIAISLLYLSKILSTFIILLIIYYLNKPLKINKDNREDKINYSKEIKKILTNNIYKSIIEIVKNSYYYLSIIILYLVLSTRYNYNVNELGKIITFIYLYSLSIIEYLIYLAKLITKTLPNENLAKLYQTFKMILTITIIFGIISPLTCKLVFNDPSKSIYLIMVNILSIFILLYDITYENIKNKTVIYISLAVGLILKIVLIIPLINSFYRMGYNLVYGDITSTIIAMFISTIINYIYLKNKEKNKINYFDKILDIVYDNILLCIILILVEFIVPIDTSSYIKSLGLIIIYITISITYIKIKNKKRG